MPELPEVETVCRSLRQTVLDQYIRTVTVTRSRLLPNNTIEEFSETLCGHCFSAVHRRGKYILLDLDSTSAYDGKIAVPAVRQSAG